MLIVYLFMFYFLLQVSAYLLTKIKLELLVSLITYSIQFPFWFIINEHANHSLTIAILDGENSTRQFIFKRNALKLPESLKLYSLKIYPFIRAYVNRFKGW